MAKIRIELTEKELEELVFTYLTQKIHNLDRGKVTIEVKSKQNWKSEWEKASYRAVYTNE